MGRVEKKGDSVLEKLINDGLIGTSVTAILIGNETAGRKWVNYEIQQSQAKGNGIIGIYIHQIKTTSGLVDPKGRNPLDDWTATKNGRKVPFSSLYPTYDWVANDGYNNFSGWVETAAKKAGY